jgi:hypothetical protein
MQAGHVGLRPGLIDEHQPRGRDFALSLFPLPAPAGHVGAILFAGAQAFFASSLFGVGSDSQSRG